MRLILAIAVAVPALVFTASAQDDTAQVRMMKMEAERMAAQAKIVGFRSAVMGKTVKDAPYSATEITETNQVLADGTRIHNETRAQVYRDSEGRTRRETPDAITIWDPVAKVSYMLNPKDQTARQLPLAGGMFFVSEDGKATGLGGKPNVTWNMRVAGPDSPDVAKAKIAAEKAMVEAKAAAEASASPDAKPRTRVELRTEVVNGGPSMDHMVYIRKLGQEGASESLGTRSIEGVTAEGTRMTTTIKAGEIGNDRPLQIINERWFSPDLQMIVQSRFSDPRTGEETFRLTDVSRAEPAPYLFQVPSGYQIVNVK